MKSRLAKRIALGMAVAAAAVGLAVLHRATITGPSGSQAFYDQIWQFAVMVAVFAVFIGFWARAEKDIFFFWFMLSFPVVYFLALFGCSAFIGLWRDEIRLVEAPLARATDEALRIAHISDLHLAVDQTMEGAISGAKTRASAAEAIRSGLERAQLLVISGDITDSGSDQEWALFEQLLNDLSDGERERVLFVPGNHDLSLTTGTGTPIDPFATLNHEHKSKRFAVHALARAPRSWMVPRPEGAIPVRDILNAASAYVQVYERNPPQAIVGSARGAPPSTVRYSKEVQELAAKQRGPGNVWPRSDSYTFGQLLQAVYPMILYEDDRTVIVGLDSNRRPADSMASSGFGWLGGRQLESLDRILSATVPKCQLLLVHHHVGLPGWAGAQLKRLGSRLQTRGLQLTDAREFQALLARRHPAAVLFGHLHTTFTAIFDGVRLLSAPSTGYGDQIHPEAPRVAGYGIRQDCQITALN